MIFELFRGAAFLRRRQRYTFYFRTGYVLSGKCRVSLFFMVLLIFVDIGETPDLLGNHSANIVFNINSHEFIKNFNNMR